MNVDEFFCCSCLCFRYNQATAGKAWAQIVLKMQRSCVTLVIQECFLPSTCNLSLKNVNGAVCSLGSKRCRMFPVEHMVSYVPYEIHGAV